MLSSKLDISYKKENFVNYFDPLKVLNLVFNLSPYVKLIHDYISIPQREFMLIIRKNHANNRQFFTSFIGAFRR